MTPQEIKRAYLLPSSPLSGLYECLLALCDSLEPPTEQQNKLFEAAALKAKAENLRKWPGRRSKKELSWELAQLDVEIARLEGEP